MGKIAHNHIHKYQRVMLGSGREVVYIDGKRHLRKSGGKLVYKCIVPGCSHYNYKEMLIGAITVCWKCEEELILTSRSLSLKHPVHFECRKGTEVA